MIFLNLFLDGFTNSTQDQIFKKYKMISWAMMFYMNLASGLMMLLWLCSPFTDEGPKAIAFMMKHDQLLIDILAFCACGAFGQVCVCYD